MPSFQYVIDSQNGVQSTDNFTSFTVHNTDNRLNNVLGYELVSCSFLATYANVFDEDELRFQLDNSTGLEYVLPVPAGAYTIYSLLTLLEELIVQTGSVSAFTFSLNQYGYVEYSSSRKISFQNSMLKPSRVVAMVGLTFNYNQFETDVTAYILPDLYVDTDPTLFIHSSELADNNLLNGSKRDIIAVIQTDGLDGFYVAPPPAYRQKVEFPAPRSLSSISFKLLDSNNQTFKHIGSNVQLIFKMYV